MTVKPLFISTYPPRECGIATFTNDLVNAIEQKATSVECSIVAISKEKHLYNEKVVFDINQDKFSDYVKAANYINISKNDVVVIEHEYGIFGGQDGEYIIPFVKLIKKPIITTFHTVLKNPNTKQFEILKKLSEISYKVITMANSTKDILINQYDVPEEKIKIIHHGVPLMNLADTEYLKKKYNLENKKIISTFGLISPGKGLEYSIKAMEKISKEVPNAIYLILGQTHPCVKKIKGEEYRNSLVSLVNQLNISNNVMFVDRYLTKKEIMEYLKISDVYLTPYIGREQAVSGTLAYAIGSGKAIVSTPYTYAKEMLSDGRGLLVEFEDHFSIADAVISILIDDKLKKSLETKAFKIGKEMFWPNIASKVINLLKGAANTYKKVGVIA
ncbi:glycosyltransferase family 4 protein [Caldicellulosiruptoraceae bacterium PP1]